MSINGGYPAPATVSHETDTCRRGCCWTPYAGVCAQNRWCMCHLDRS